MNGEPSVQPGKVTVRFERLFAATIARLSVAEDAQRRFVRVDRSALTQTAARLVVPSSLTSADQKPVALSSLRSGRPDTRSNPALSLNPGGRAWNRLVPTLSPMASRPVDNPLPKSLDHGAREAAVANLRARVVACAKCPNLVSSRKSVVFGVGDIHARIMFVGEAPGADEDAQGEPFVGRAGELLTKIIAAMGFSRSQVFIANILKCRPDTPGQSAGNRKPTPAEMATCSPWLHEQINLLQPEVMVALGATAVEGLLGKTEGITRLRGHWQSYRGIPLMPTFHPAYLLRNQAPAEKRKLWEDMLAVLKHLGLPISQKQQDFFLQKNSP